MTSAEHDRRIDYIEFSVKSVPDAKRFYAAAFGWSFEDYGPDYASFSDGRLSGGFQTATKARTGGVIARPIFSFPGGRRFHFTDLSSYELAVWSDK